MRSILRANNKLTLPSCGALALLLIQINLACAAPQIKEDCEPQSGTHTNHQRLMSSICDASGNRINLYYAKREHRIWLKSKRFLPNEFTVLRLERGADPDLVGADENIRILFGKTVILQGREFLILTTAERTSTGHGGGRCGAGSEVHLNIYELRGRDISAKDSRLIESCLEGMELKSQNTGLGAGSNPIELEQDRIKILWFDYPKFENPVVGIYSILDSRLSIRTSQ